MKINLDGYIIETKYIYCVTPIVVGEYASYFEISFLNRKSFRYIPETQEIDIAALANISSEEEFEQYQMGGKKRINAICEAARDFVLEHIDTPQDLPTFNSKPL
jgi:hypothetical protein